MKKAAFLLIFVMILTGSKLACAYEEKPKPVLVVYDNPNLLNRDYFGPDNDFSVLFSEQLGHFNTAVETIKEKEYKKGMLENYQFIFYLSLREKDSVNSQLLQDIANTTRTVVWYGEDIDELLNINKDIPLKFLGISKRYNLVTYKGIIFNLGQDSGINLLVEPLREGVSTYGEVNNGRHVYPLIVNWKNYWYMSGLDTSGIKYFVFSDVLHEIFGEAHNEVRKVYLRIEDVSVLRSPKRLKEIADFLYSRKVPFLIALIPAYINPNSGTEASITDYPELVEAVKYMVERGGTVVLHGYTHQYYKSETGEGFEFWDAFEDRPLNVNYADYVRDRVIKGIEVCLENGLYPLAFEPPHYAMAQEGYAELKKYFSTVIGQIQTTDKRFGTAAPPYEIKNTKRFNRFLPESLGYVAGDGSTGVKEILDNAAKLLLVRDADTGVFFHNYMDMKYLEQIVEGLKSLGYVFGDLGREDNWVKAGNYSIKSSGGNIVYERPLLLKERASELRKKERMPVTYSIIEVASTLLAVLVAVSVIRLIYTYFKVRNRQKKSLFEEKE
jgi:uncharacterized protein YdaL